MSMVQGVDTLGLINTSVTWAYPPTSLVEAQARARRQKVLEAPDVVRATGTRWYLSENGSSDNEGSAPSCPWNSLETLEENRHRIRAGDAVLFERGSIFRGCITAVSGVYYGAYGSGDKPCIYGSKKDYAGCPWEKAGENLWSLDDEFPADVGNIIFDHGAVTGYKRLHRSDLHDPFDFWSDPQDGNRLYLYMDKDPAASFTSIEIAFNLWLFQLGNCTDIVVDNLTFKYGGGHGVRGSGCRDITVRNCEFGFLGGSYLTGFRNGTTRYGNAVEFMAGSKRVLVENCWVYQIYDSGYTHQGLTNYCASDITFRDSLLEYCGMGSIEYWLGPDSLCRNVTYSGNIMRYAGYGFGGIQRPDKEMSAHIQSNGACCNQADNFRIENNIFELSTYDLVNAQSKMNTLPVLKGNMYIQSAGSRLGSYGGCLSCMCDGNAETVIRTQWGDTSAILIRV